MALDEISARGDSTLAMVSRETMPEVTGALHAKGRMLPKLRQQVARPGLPMGGAGSL